MIFWFSFGCSTPSPPTTPPPAADTQPAKTIGLSLDANGARWKMDEHTRKVMKQTRTTAEMVKLSDAEEGQKVGQKLSDEFDELVQGCTMEGAAHDELHVFLMAWVPHVTALKDAKDLPTATSELRTLRTMLDEYDAHFE